MSKCPGFGRHSELPFAKEGKIIHVGMLSAVEARRLCLVLSESIFGIKVNPISTTNQILRMKVDKLFEKGDDRVEGLKSGN